MQFKDLVRYPLDVRRARRMIAQRADHCPLAQGPRQPVASRSSDFFLRFPSLERSRHESHAPCAHRQIVLDLTSTDLLFDCGRHLMTFAHWAHAIGSPFAFRCGPMVLSAMSRKIHGRELLSQTNACWIDGALPSTKQSIDPDALVLADALDTPPLPEMFRGTVVHLLVGRDIDPSLPVMPYPMHPWTMRTLNRDSLLQLRRKPRSCGLFFAGNQKAKYGDDKIRREFGVASRLELLQTLKQHFAMSIRQTLDHQEDASIVLIDSREKSIAPDDWLSTVAQARFFLCCPGAAQPMCHNLVEAMSVGTIPVLEYSDRLTPRLIDGETAICFRGTEGLVEAVDRLNSMSQSEFARISTNVSCYYDEYLSGAKFLREIRDGEREISQGLICVPFHDRNFYPGVTNSTATRAA